MDPSSACPNGLHGTSHQMFLTLLQALSTSHCKLGEEGRYPADYGPKLQNGEVFDFIVVGGGTAGALLANRLSVVSRWRVLLIEAGSHPSIMTEIPALFLNLQFSEEDWQYKTERSASHSSGLKDEICLYPRGKVLGGSSAINAMLYLRGYKGDFDGWAEEGNVGWDYKSLVGYHKKFEKGELNVSRSDCEFSICKLLIRSYQEMGFGEKTDTNHIGYGDSLMTVVGGTRQNSAKAFLAEIKDRKNLFLALKAQVSRLTFGNGRVDGVEVFVDQKWLKLKADKEVILSAGTINSPQILMNSGIGPKEHLANLKIPLIKDLRVGENFQDHSLFLGMVVEIDEEFFPPKSEVEKINDIYRYAMHREGYYTKVPLINFLFHGSTMENDKYPDLQINHLLFARNSRKELIQLYTNFNYHPDLLSTILESNEKNSIVVFYVKCLSSKSRGKILLRSSHPFDHPRIYPNYLSDESGEDIDTMLYGLRLVQRLITTKTFADARPTVLRLNTTKCETFEYDTDDYWKCMFRHYVTHLHHPCGTCKMGPVEDPTSVVGSDLKVHGVRGVRVVDASIMPKIVRANTMSATYVVAEKGADLIKEEWLIEHSEL